MISDVAYIAGITNKAEGEEWSGRIWPTGLYTYDTVSGASKTVRRWSSNKDDAIATVVTNAQSQQGVEPNTRDKVNTPATKFAKHIGMKSSELTTMLGQQMEGVPPIIPGITEISFVGRSVVDYQKIIVTTEMLDDTCFGISFTKLVGSDKPRFTNDEIQHWMIAYSQGTNNQWKQTGPKKWTLEKGPETPYTYYADWLQPNAFMISTKELIEHTIKK